MAKTRKNPTIRCPICQRKLSQYHLDRHQGTYECMRKHYVIKERSKLSIPTGYNSVGGYVEGFVWWVFDQAGFNHVTTPLSMRTMFTGDEPHFSTLAPTWIAMLSFIYDRRDPNAMDLVVLARYLHEKEDEESINNRLALATEIELSCFERAESGEHKYLEPDKARKVLRRWASEALGGTTSAE